MYKTTMTMLVLGSLVLQIEQANAIQIIPNIPISANDLTTFEPIKSTFRTSTNTTGCPSGFRGKFTFLGKVINNTSDSALSDLRVEVERLTRGNLLRVDGNVLQNDDGGGEGIEAPLSVGVIGPSDAAPGPKDFVDVPFEVCLKRVRTFTLQANVLAEADPALVDFSPEGIQQFLMNYPDVDSPAKFLERLPLEYKQHWIMVTRRESAQKSTATEPRLLLPNKDSDSVFGFCTGKPCRDDKGVTVDVVEHIQFDKIKNKFRFTDISFPGGTAKVDLGGPEDGGTGPGLCKGCHGQNPRPNWDTYDNWTNILPFNRDRIYKGSQEEEAFIRLLDHLVNDPIIKQLKLLEGEGVTRDRNGLTTIKPDGVDSHDAEGAEKTVSYVEKPVSEMDKRLVPEYTGCFPTSGANCKSLPFTRGGDFLTLHHSKKGSTSDEGRGVALFDNFSGFNAQRVAQELLVHPRDPMKEEADIRPIALAIAENCVTLLPLGRGHRLVAGGVPVGACGRRDAIAHSPPHGHRALLPSAHEARSAAWLLPPLVCHALP